MAIDDHGRAPVLGRPVVPHGQAELVGLAGGFAVQGEFPDLARAAALHVRLHPRMGNDQLAAVKDIMTDESIQKIREVLGKPLAAVAGQCIDLGERLRQAMRNPHVLATQLAHQLDVVVAGQAKRRAGSDHVADQTNRIENARTAVHKIADENRLATLRMRVHGADSGR